jgi:phage terminase small subunit
MASRKPNHKPKLTSKQALFVAEYLRDFNATQAGQRAGYKHRDMGRQLLTFPHIMQAIEEGKRKLLSKVDLSAERALRELARLAFSDVRKLYDDQGNLIPIHQLDDDAAATIASVEVVTAPTGDGESVINTRKIKTWDKTANLQNMLKHFGMLIDRSENKTQISFAAALKNIEGKTRGLPDDDEEEID